MPEYGTNLRALIPPVDTAQLRATIEREVRRTLNDLAPGVDPGIILDVLVDVTVEGHKQTQVQVNMTTMHEVTYSAPAHAEPATTASGRHWVPRNPVRFRQEVAADFLPAVDERGFFNEAVRHHDDMVDSMRMAMEAIRPMDQGQTGSCTSSAAALRNVDENFRMPMMPSFLGRNRPSPPAKLHPFVEAILRAKQPRKVVPEPKKASAPTDGRLVTNWERIRRDYALFT